MVAWNPFLILCVHNLVLPDPVCPQSGAGVQATAYFSRGLWSLMVLKPQRALHKSSQGRRASGKGPPSYGVASDTDTTMSDEGEVLTEGESSGSG